MTAVQNADRIWLIPQKFWAATKGVPQEEVDQLVDRLMCLAESRDFDALRKYDFISIGDKYLERNAS